MLKVLQFAALAALVALASGCATITKGTTQTVTIDTDPNGANCTLSREGRSIAVINPTPGSIAVDKTVRDIGILCKRKDYLDTSGTMASTFQSMTFGNILFGGLIGVAIDAASGAMNEYPPMITITLIPAEFATAADRDAFFDRMKATLVREASEVKERVGKNCHEEKQCTTQLEAADKETKVKLDEIEQKRAQAKLRVG